MDKIYIFQRQVSQNGQKNNFSLSLITANTSRRAAFRCNYTEGFKKLPKHYVTFVSFQIQSRSSSRFYPIACRVWALFVISPLGQVLSSQLFSMQARVMASLAEKFLFAQKLRQNLLEIQDRTLERIQKVIWDHLLAFKGEIIQKQALFSLPFRTLNNSRVVLIYAVCSVFSFVLFSTSPRSFFRLN